MFFSNLGMGMRSRLVWVLVILLGGTVAFFGLPVVPGTAAEHSAAEPAGAVPSVTGMQVVLAETTPPEAPGIGARATSTHTVFLPMAFRDYWEPADSAFGVQILWAHPMYPDRIDYAGARWVRIPLTWAGIEPQNTTPENYQWSGAVDEVLADLSARGVKIILTLGGNPSWAATYPGGPVDLVGIEELVEFMVAAVAHYSAPPYNVKSWEFYNEPDCGHELCGEFGFSYWGYQPDVYAEMLAAVYQPMKAADPEAQIVLGGLAYDWWIESGGPFVEGFLDGVLQHDGGEFFDVMNFHYYPVFHARWDPHGMGIIGKTAYLREKLAEYGVSKPFICTEAGMWSDEANGGSHELQSRYVPQAFARSMAADVQVTIWFMLVDDDTLGTQKYGLLNPDLSPKLSYWAYQTLARQLAPTEYVGPLDPAETGTEQVEGYEFVTVDGLNRIAVAWTNDERAHTISLLADRIDRVSKFGERTAIRDADDGMVDGSVTVVVGPSPVYLRRQSW